MKTTKSVLIYDLQTLPAGLIYGHGGDGEGSVRPTGADAAWSGTKPVPAIGSRVKVRGNDLGAGVVIAYFVEHGWLGVHVRLDSPPAWHRKQNTGRYAGQALVFGCEVATEA